MAELAVSIHHKKRKESKDKTTPFGINFMRSQSIRCNKGKQQDEKEQDRILEAMR
jgi:hypothetical protein